MMLTPLDLESSFDEFTSEGRRRMLESAGLKLFDGTGDMNLTSGASLSSLNDGLLNPGDFNKMAFSQQFSTGSMRPATTFASLQDAASRTTPSVPANSQNPRVSQYRSYSTVDDEALFGNPSQSSVVDGVQPLGSVSDLVAEDFDDLLGGVGTLDDDSMLSLADGTTEADLLSLESAFSPTPSQNTVLESLISNPKVAAAKPKKKRQRKRLTESKKRQMRNERIRNVNVRYAELRERLSLTRAQVQTFKDLVLQVFEKYDAI